MKLKIKTAYNAVPSKGQVFRMPSETIQGQVLSISDMLARVQRGVPISGIQLDYTDEEIPFPRVQDITDMDEVRNELNQLRLNFEARQTEKADRERKQLELNFEAQKQVHTSRIEGQTEQQTE